MRHAILIGDSIFDNAPYVTNGRCVSEHLQTLLPEGDKATLIAVDGDCIEHVYAQLQQIPENATHLFLSIGGNDVLGHRELLLESMSGQQMLEQLVKIQTEFHVAYSKLLQNILTHKLPLAVCTIYDAVPGLMNIEITALSIFNVIILSQAIRHNLHVLDLRQVCNGNEDFSMLSPIEPSSVGGQKIAAAIAKVILSDNRKRTAIYF